jgi:hypothetical protein
MTEVCSTGRGPLRHASIWVTLGGDLHVDVEEAATKRRQWHAHVADGLAGLALGGKHVTEACHPCIDAAKAHVEKRFGNQQVWILNPGVPEANIPNGSGTDYMLMWTQVLEGRDGLGEDFDFVYFVGPRDFARYFALDGEADMLKIERFFDKRLESDVELKKAVDKGLTRSAFRNYYALKASTTFSKGAHDEWNIIRALNERRRAHDRFGIANQLAVLFDGGGVAPPSSEGATSDGYAGKCVN